mmetsp:Transcript_50164/g.82647  ORF Transcript_50164/g.82647 Transcript_50164/m.82647 type:complete len:287 (-) Transcript_50164:315-1175(-)
MSQHGRGSVCWNLSGVFALLDELFVQFSREFQRREEAEQNISIFVDNSNIARGCQMLSTGRDRTQQLCIRSFSEVVAGHRRVSLRAVGEQARTQRGQHPRWQGWNSCGFWVEWQHCLACCVHGYVENLERHGADQAREVLALCTGDGQLASTVESVARRGWRVEIWCWRATCDPAYLTLQRSGRVRVCYLDGYRPEITMQHRLHQLRHRPRRPRRPRRTRAEPRLVVGNEEPENPCVICFSAEAIYALRPCNHRVFCQSCSQEWLRRSELTCPLCRRDVDDIELDD